MSPLQPSFSALPKSLAMPINSDGLQAPALQAAAGGFSAELSRMIDDTRARGAAAQAEVEGFARVETPGRVHEVLIAATKAEIALRTMVTVRNKLVDAYKELLHVTT